MGIVGKLKQDCKELYEKYSALNPRNDVFAKTKKEVREEKKNLLESGRLVVDFYDNSFIPKYSKSSNEVVKDAGYLLYALAGMATEAINSENYFSLCVLLLPKGCKKGDSNRLEVLIEKLEEAIEVNKK